MAKIGVEVAVDAAAFQQYFDIFQIYNKALRSHPAEWEKVAEQAGVARDSFAEAAQAVKDLSDNMNGVLRNAQGFERASDRTSIHWMRMARNTKDVAGNIASATISLLKWANVVGIVTGIVGAGSLYGIDRLAGSVSSNRTSALGLGTSYGGLQAARINYGTQIGDAEGMLGRIVEAQNDVSKRVGFGALGISGDKLLGRDTNSVAADALEAIGKFVDSTPPDILQNRLDSSHVGDIVSIQEARRIGSLKPEARHRIADAMRSDAQSLNLDPKTQESWQKLSTQLSRAESEIETAFVRNLVKAEPGLEKLSTALADLAKHLLEKEGPVSQWLGEINTGLENFATSMESPEFREELSSWFKWAVQIAKNIFEVSVEVGQFLGLISRVGSGQPNPGAASSPASGPSVTSEQLAPYRGHSSAPGGHSARENFGKRGWWTDERIQHAYDRLVAGGLSPKEAEGQISRMAYVEAAGGPTSKNASGHLGIFQADRNRQQDFGGSTDFDAQLDAIAKEKHGSEARSHIRGLNAQSDMDGAIAASMFERGEGFDKASGRDAFTDKTARGMPKIHAIVSRPRTSVTINNAPGASVATGAAAAAVPP